MENYAHEMRFSFCALNYDFQGLFLVAERIFPFTRRRLNVMWIYDKSLLPTRQNCKNLNHKTFL